MTVVTAAATELENAWAGQGAVLLDIGGDVGALVVTMPSSMVGLEVEIRPLDDESVREHAHGHDHVPAHAPVHLAHVAVVARPVGGGHLPSLVLADLQAGEYELFEKGRPDAVALRVAIVGGEVASVSWPEPA
jgi:hypothetical protein